MNFLTFDIEEWFHANYETIDFNDYNPLSTNLESNVDRLIDLCAKHNVKATCFVLGSVAKNKPQIVQKLLSNGHEIASHGYGHQLVYNMEPDKFKKDLIISCDILEQITAKKVTGYRAPCWSVNKENINWYYDILEECGIKYSSSIYPAETFLYGIKDFSQHIHFPDVKGKKSKVLEVPVPVFKLLTKKIGFSGGFYLRLLPTWLIKMNISSRIQRDIPTFIYLHPREIDIAQPRLKLNKIENFIHYYNINRCEKKLENIINSYSDTFMPIETYISTYH